MRSCARLTSRLRARRVFTASNAPKKYLKAFLQEHAVRFERKHDLLPLGALCAQIDVSFEDREEDLQNLERYAVAVRYPGTTASVEMAEAAFDAAERVRKFIRGKFGLD
jgi:HEPN domain-containing protein